MKRTLSTIAALMLGSTMALAQAGLDPVLQALERQGYTVREVVREQNRIRIEAERDGRERQLVYDSNTGQRISDTAERLQDRDRDRDRDMVLEQDRDRDRDRDQLGLGPEGAPGDQGRASPGGTTGPGGGAGLPPRRN
jgi:hypothetical protein